MREPGLCKRARWCSYPGRCGGGAQWSDSSPQKPPPPIKGKKSTHAHLTPRPRLSGASPGRPSPVPPRGVRGNAECAEDTEILLLKATRRRHLDRA